jgi:peptide/nickel transport system substrate-binding protein
LTIENRLERTLGDIKMKRLVWLVSISTVVIVLLVACAGETVVTKEVIKEVPVEVEKIVEKEVPVEVERVVEKEVEKIVQVEVEKVVEVEREVVKGGQLIMGMQLEPDNLDPAVTPWAVSHSVMMNIYDTVVYENHDASFHPGLAESWEVSNDGLSYTFNLREGVTFHDGTPFNADAVKFNFDRISDPETKSGFAVTLLGPYAGSDIKDDQTITVNFETPFAPFLDGASQAFLGMVSPTAVEEHGEDYGINPVGTGFMKFKKWVRGDHIELVRNEDYNWAPPIWGHQGPAYLESIIIKMIPEQGTRMATLESGETNFILAVPAAEFARLAGDANYQIILGNMPGLPNVVMINTSLAPTDDLAVRQALMHALDRETVRKIVNFGIPGPTENPLSTYTAGYNYDNEGMYPHDPDKARELLEGAGWSMGSDGFYEKDGNTLKLITGHVGSQKDTLTVLQAQARTVGIDWELSELASSTWIDSAKAGKFNAAGIGWVSSDPIILEQFYHSKNIDSGFNWPRYSDSHMDDILDRASGSTDPEERVELYGEVQKIAMENATVYPIHDNVGISASASNVVGIKADIRGFYHWLYDAYVREE